MNTLTNYKLQMVLELFCELFKFYSQFSTFFKADKQLKNDWKNLKNLSSSRWLNFNNAYNN